MTNEINEMKEMKEMEEMEKEIKRLKTITDRLWREGKASGWENMPHTNKGVARHESKKRFETIHKSMKKLTTPSITKKSTTKKSKSQQKSMNFMNPNNNSSRQFNLIKKVSYARLFL